MRLFTYPNGFESARLRLDAGDLVYSLMFCRILGTKKIFFGKNDDVGFYVNKDGSCGGNGKCSEKTINFLSSLMFRQRENFDAVEKYENQDFSFDYGEYHINFPPIYGTNLTEWHARKFNINWMDLGKAWLIADKNESLKGRVVINKTLRYTTPRHPFFKSALDKFGNSCIFVGIKSDHAAFQEEYGIAIDFFDSDDSLEMANAINSCDIFIGNSSFCAAVAIGLGKKCNIQLNKINNYLFLNSNVSFFL